MKRINFIQEIYMAACPAESGSAFNFEACPLNGGSCLVGMYLGRIRVHKELAEESAFMEQLDSMPFAGTSDEAMDQLLAADDAVAAAIAGEGAVAPKSEKSVTAVSALDVLAQEVTSSCSGPVLREPSRVLRAIGLGRPREVCRPNISRQEFYDRLGRAVLPQFDGLGAVTTDPKTGGSVPVTWRIEL